MNPRQSVGSSALVALKADTVRMMYARGFGKNPSGWTTLKFFVLNPEFRCVAAYRIHQYAGELRKQRNPLAIPVKAFWWLLNRWVCNIDHAEISIEADIGPGLILMHRSGVIIGPAVIGANCFFHHNLTIGQAVAGGSHSLPRIGDQVWIGPGCIIAGDITIGDNVTISAGSVVGRDIPSRSLVAGNPARIIAKDYDNSDLIGLLPTST